jgi:hypothetical protein
MLPVSIPLAEQRGYSLIHSPERLASKDQVESLVGFLMADEGLNINGLPNSIKDALFTFIVTQFFVTAMHTMYDSVTNTSLFGHHMDLYMSNVKKLNVEDQLRALDEEEEKAGRGPVAIDEIESLVDAIMANAEINVRVIPDSVEKMVFVKTIHVCIHCIQRLLAGSRCEAIGYEMQGTFRAKSSPGSSTRERSAGMSSGRAVKVVRAYHDARHEVDKVLLSQHVSEMLTIQQAQAHDTAAAVGGLQAYLEKPIIGAVTQLALYVVYEVLKDLVFNILGDNVRLRLVPGPPEEGDSGDSGGGREGGGDSRMKTPTHSSTPNNNSGAKKRRVFTTKWISKRLTSPAKTPIAGTGTGTGTGTASTPAKAGNDGTHGSSSSSSSFMGWFRGMTGSSKEKATASSPTRTPPRRRSSWREGGEKRKGRHDNGDEDDDNDDDDDDFGPDPMPGSGLWRDTEGVTLQWYLDSYRPPRTLRRGQRYEVREALLDQVTEQILDSSEFHIVGMPQGPEKAMYRAVAQSALQTFLSTFHKSITSMNLGGHHLEFDVEEGIKPFIFNTQHAANIKSVEALAQALINDPDVNLSLLPDFIEVQLYRNVMLITLLIVQNICDSSCVDMFGHCLEFTLKPLSDAETSALHRKQLIDLMASHVPPSRIDDEILTSFVEANDPDSSALHNTVMTAGYRVALYVAREALQEVACFVLEDGLVMRLAPGVCGQQQEQEEGDRVK